MGICSITCVIRGNTSEETKVEDLSKYINYSSNPKKNDTNVHKKSPEQKHRHKHRHSVYKLPNEEKTSISPISLLRPIKHKKYIKNSDEEQKKNELDAISKIQDIFRDEYMNSKQ